MKIIGLFDHYFLILIFIQFLISSLIDVNKFKRSNNLREAAIIKHVSSVILAVSLIMTVIAYVLK